MTTYTPRQRLYFRHASAHRKGGSVREGTASVLRNLEGRGTCLVPLSSIPDAELEVRIRTPRALVAARAGDDDHLFVAIGPEDSRPTFAELAAIACSLRGARKLGVRELVDAAANRERWPKMPEGVRVFAIVPLAEAQTDPPEVLAQRDTKPAKVVEPEPEPVRDLGRADYAERREARIERLENGAARARGEAAAAFAGVDRIAGHIPLGQPILVGHHSEKRHRADLKRIDRGMRRGVDAQKRAAELETAARSAERNDAISSDDPEALQRLRSKLAELERERAQIKATNVACRRGDETAIAVVREACHLMHWHDPAKGFPSYVLSNLGARIRDVEQRIADMLREASRPARGEVCFGGWSCRENRDTNRVEIRTPGGARCSDAEYRALKSNGFRWARTVGAFVRLLNDNAWSAAERFVRSMATADELAAARAE